MKKLLIALSYLLVAFVAALFTFVSVQLSTPVVMPQYSKLTELEELITAKFIGESDKTVMEDAAADAMVDSLGDRWSYYISASDYNAYQEQMENAYVGIGVTIQESEEGLLVTKVNSASPALEAGIQPGDVIVFANGKNVLELGMDAAADEVKGEEGTTVEITVMRNGQQITMIVERRKVYADVATCRMLEGNIGLIRIENFDSRCAEMTIACIDEMMNAGAKGLIFDVRFNPGGYKDELVQILDYLLPEGPLFKSVDYRGAEYTDTSDASCLVIPMMVLVNEDSYSAAEFFAAALREYGVAKIVGMPTCGKGYFQNTFRLSDGSAVGLSVGKYYTPNGVSLAGVGLTPDYVVEVDDETAFAIYAGTLDPMEDIQIITALDALK